jgi:hypothetical protein
MGNQPMSAPFLGAGGAAFAPVASADLPQEAAPVGETQARFECASGDGTALTLHRPVNNLHVAMHGSFGGNPHFYVFAALSPADARAFAYAILALVPHETPSADPAPVSEAQPRADATPIGAGL